MMKKDEAARYKRILLEIRKQLVGDVNHLADQVMRRNRKDAAGDLSSMPIHMADLGSDNFEHEFSFSLLENEEDRLGQIDAALARLDKGGYGTCSTCQCAIPKTRLNAIPWTSTCVNCARATEQTS